MDSRGAVPAFCGRLLDMDIPVEAAAQRGCFTTAQAAAGGWSTADLEGAVRRRRLQRVRRGVYVEVEGWAALDGAALHATTVRAEQLALGDRWLAARGSTAVLSGVAHLGGTPSEPQLLAEPLRPGERSSHVNRRLAAVPHFQRRQAFDVPSVSVFRMAVDIAREDSFREGVVVADDILRRGADRREFDVVLSGMRGWPGAERARRVVAFADGLAESPLESISRVAVHQLGLPPPALQVEVWLGGRFLGRADALWQQYNTVGESDGLEKYGDTTASQSIAFKAEKQRQEAMEDVGLEVVRWTWDEAWRPDGVLDARLRRAFSRGAAQRLDPGVRFVTTTVKDRLRRAA